MMDIAGSAINGSHAHDSLFAHLEAKEGTMEILLNGLCRPYVVAYLLIFGVFLQGVLAFDGVKRCLLCLESTVQKGQNLLLSLEFHVQHQFLTGFAGLECFGIQNLDTVDLCLCFFVVATFVGSTGNRQFLIGFFLDAVSAGCQCQRAAKEDNQFFHHTVYILLLDDLRWRWDVQCSRLTANCSLLAVCRSCYLPFTVPRPFIVYFIATKIQIYPLFL
ncbi:hypothetical protein DW108_19185 [Bacteroides thetaiotaomicron]|nr:hypothetical protein DW108_19185 [Bacteroides thetaiotaomicron]